ncbi:MAG: prepilin-type N-terminal cleavage/methylation domain-containing protein [Candidatus Moranbacteria bacterium]|nr:prepilin-type N-terminal cleavage/methylation domain-containing protein [Candidatus Moranbacteria bacterium]
MSTKRNKKGMSLIEMIVAIAIFTIGLGIFTLLFVRSWEMYNFSFSTGQSQVMASQGVQRLVDIIRNAQQADNGAFPLVVAQEEEIVLYTNIDEDASIERVRIFFSHNKIFLEIRNASAGTPPQYASGYETSQEIIRDIIQEDGHVIFSYYDKLNTRLTGTFPINDVKMVKIDIMVDDNVEKLPEGISIESHASIRNLNQYDRAN